MYIMFRSCNIHSFSSMFAKLSTGIVRRNIHKLLKSLSRSIRRLAGTGGDQSHSGVMGRSARKTRRKSSAPCPKQCLSCGKAGTSVADDTGGWTVVRYACQIRRDSSTARVLLLYFFHPGNKDSLKHPQRPRRKNGSLLNAVPLFVSLNAVCPLCGWRPLHKRASPLRV